VGEDNTTQQIEVKGTNDSHDDSGPGIEAALEVSKVTSPFWEISNI
jgi:hypothetical protein